MNVSKAIAPSKSLDKVCGRPGPKKPNHWQSMAAARAPRLAVP